MIRRWPIATLAGALVLDTALHARRWSYAVAGPLDECAHLATTALLVGGLPGPPNAAFLLGAAVGAVALDMDHVPGAFGRPIRGTHSERPFTHSLPAFVAPAATALWLDGARGRFAGGALLGLATHVFRDIYTGNGGVPLWWPVSGKDRRLPRPFFTGALALWAFAAACRAEP